MSAPSIIVTPRQAREWREAHPKLAQIVHEIVELWPSDISFVVTCIGRTVEEDRALKASGIHAAGPPWRALDFRIRNLGPDCQRRADELAEVINSRWVYDPARPHLQVLFTAEHGSGPHGHAQVHPHTYRRP